jgi:hypothetical protein
VKSAIALTITCSQNSSSSRAPSWPKLPKKYIFIALRSVMLDYPMDLRPAASDFCGSQLHCRQSSIGFIRSQEDRTCEAAADRQARRVGYVCF